MNIFGVREVSIKRDSGKWDLVQAEMTYVAFETLLHLKKILFSFALITVNKVC